MGQRADLRPVFIPLIESIEALEVQIAKSGKLLSLDPAGIAKIPAVGLSKMGRRNLPYVQIKIGGNQRDEAIFLNHVPLPQCTPLLLRCCLTEVLSETPRYSRLAIMRDVMPDPASRFSAAMPDSDAPRALYPSRSQASRATPSIADYFTRVLPSTVPSRLLLKPSEFHNGL
jgi:hypothetical protein